MKKTSRAEYWKNWYWNKGGREKVQATRKIREYNRYKEELKNGL